MGECCRSIEYRVLSIEYRVLSIEIAQLALGDMRYEIAQFAFSFPLITYYL